MNSGCYRHIIEVYDYQETDKENELGEKIRELVKVGQFFGSFQNKTGHMLYGRIADTKLASTTHKISYRFDNFPTLNEDNILKINNDYYKIDYIDNLDNMGVTMEVFLTRDNLRGHPKKK